MKDLDEISREALRKEIMEMINSINTLRYLQGIRDYAVVPYNMEREKRTSKTE